MGNFFSSAIDRAAQRAYLKHLGANHVAKPVIGIVYSVGGFEPCNLFLQKELEAIKGGIIEQGALPVLLPIAGAGEGFGLANSGNNYLLAMRELCADSCEAVLSSHLLDGAVLFGASNTALAGMLMGAARVNLPTIAFSAGYFVRESGTKDIYEIISIASAMRAGKRNVNDLPQVELDLGGGASYEQAFSCVIEALAAPFGNGGVPLGAKRLALAHECGVISAKLVEKNISLKMLLSKAALQNALNLAISIGAGTNCFLDLMAIANECGEELSLDSVRAAVQKVPVLACLNQVDLNQFHNAGGVRAVLKELDTKKLIDSSTTTVGGQPLSYYLADAQITDDEIIRTVSNPFPACIGVLEGNLADDGAICRKQNVEKGAEVFCAKARTFLSEQEALLAIANGSIAEGDAIVLKYCGAKGAPAMPDIAAVVLALKGVGLEAGVAVLTDGRCSLSGVAPVVAHIAPEAADGGNLALVSEGDKIIIDLAKNKLTLDVSAKELSNRRKKWRPQDTVHSGYLQRYAALVGASNKGAVMKNRF